MATTANTVIQTAYSILNVFMPGDLISPGESATALVTLNNMLGRWATNNLTIPFIARTVVPLVVGQGGPSNPYTIGVGGTFALPKPPSVAAITGAGLVLGGTSPAIEVPRTVIGDDVYAAIRLKDMQNALFTYVYYNATVTSALGQINLWPVPNTTLHSLALYIKQPLPAFANLTATYDLPVGYDEAMIYNLAQRLATISGRTMPDEAKQLAIDALADIKRANTVMTDLPIDPMFVPTSGSRGHGYNILVGK